MNTPKMSYFSDIDLATLHRSRLNERIQYKLSWFNRRQKYCIPATVNQTAYNQKPIKTTTNHRFDVEPKRTTNGAANGAIIREKNSLRPHINNTRKLSANRFGNSASISKNTSTSSTIGSFAPDHCDNSTEDVRRDIDGTRVAHQKQNSNHNANEANNVTNKKRQSTVPNTQARASSRPLSLANAVNSVKKADAKHGTVLTKCLSGDAINRSANAMIDKSNDIPYADAETHPSDQSIEEDLNVVPHRKRSGTWP